jgi:shikimate kinase
VRLDRPVVLVGLMGAGKTRVGKRLAERTRLPFIDTDQEIEHETGKTITQLFETVGEAVFRNGERRIIARLLEGPVSIIAAGGGAFMDPETRDKIRRHGVAVWLRADLGTLISRTSRSNKRPLLEGVDRAARLSELMAIRHPVYAEADIVVDSGAGPVDDTVDAVLAGLAALAEKAR